MKKLVFILTILFLGACTDLEVDAPSFGDDEASTFSTFEGYQSYIAKVYASLTLTGQQGAAGQADLSVINDEGFSSYLRVWWKAQELTTDEAIIAWADAGIRDLHNHSWSSDNQFVRVFYYRIFYTISLANDFIRVASNLPAGLTNEETEEINRFIAEARYIRAFAYWHALDHFRNVVLVTSVSSNLPTQESPETVFNFIESELNEIENSLYPAGQGNHPYGRLDQGAVWMLKAKLFLNAEIYIGTPRFTDAADEANKVINSGVYQIHENYGELFMGDNDLRTNEIIWPIVHDGLVSQTWGGTTTLVRGGIGGAMMDDLDNGAEIEDEAVDNYGVPSGWGGYRSTGALVEKFDHLVFEDDFSADKSAWVRPSNGSWDYVFDSEREDGYANYSPVSENYSNDGLRIPLNLIDNREVQLTFSVNFRNGDDAVSDQDRKVLTGYAAVGTNAGAIDSLRFNRSATFNYRFNSSGVNQIRFFGIASNDYTDIQLDIVNVTYVSGIDQRLKIFTEGQTFTNEKVEDFENGWSYTKYSNIESTTGSRAPGVDQVGTDYPVFRLAEAYLILAEAELEGGGLSGTTLGYLNELRQRAYGDNSGNVTAGDVTLDWILDERARELYLEATRRTDLVRHGKFTGGDYIWPWKGGVPEGISTPSHLDIFPIPASDLIANPLLEQNDDY
ncbi:MAG: RagB/SusD family nutrient uptake outer membrane protein [Ekhidna sp.]|nr:RagB/SusD family nutrient uptake outer membrane protein [Ekhidna sp.]